MSMQIKSGTTADWELGPELINFSTLSVNGADSVVHCEGTTAKVLVDTYSALDELGKTLGIWLIHPDDDFKLKSGTYKAVLSSEQPAGNNTSWGVAFKDKNGDLIKGAEGYEGLPTMSFNCASGVGYFNVVTDDEPLVCYCSWGTPAPQSSPSPVEISVSIRKVDGYGDLLPGQAGVEFFEAGGCGAKIGAEDTQKWNELPYVGQVLPSAMYGTKTQRDEIDNPMPGQIFFVKVE